MAIMFTGSTPQDLGGNTQEHTGTQARDANFTPVASKIYVDADDTGSSFILRLDSFATDTMWLHFLHSNDTGTDYNGFADGYWMRVFSDATEVCRIDSSNDAYYLQGGGQSTLITRPAFSIDKTIDMKIVCDGVNVTVSLYYDGALEGEVTYASAVAMPTSVYFDHQDLVWNTTARNWYYSEFIITDGESTLGWRLATLTPNTQGTHTAWDGDVASVQSFGDGLMISSGTAGQKESWTLSAYGGPATNSAVRAVVNKILAAKGGGNGPSQVAPFIRHAGVDVSQAAFAPDGTYKSIILDNNPQTSLPWDTADLAALEVGVESIT
jgi:hypothetical protein